MRKDVKLGLAVGGVLLAVLVVYVLVAPGTNQPGAEFATAADTETGAGAGDATSSAGAGDTSVANGNADTTAQSGARSGTGAAGQDAQADAGAGSTGAGATGTTPGTTGGNANDTTKGSGGEKATADGGWNWDALVNGDAKVPALMTSADVRQTNNVGGATASNGTANNATGDAGQVGTSAGSNAGTGAGTAITNGGTTSADTTIGANQIAQGPTIDPLAGGSRTGAAPTTPGDAGATPSPTVVDSTPRAAAGGTHVVKVGETFSSIAAATYGNSKYYIAIQTANPSVDATRLKPGMTISLPAIDQIKSATPAAGVAAATAEQKIDPRTQYKVQENDSLYRISLKLYGKADRVEKLYEANKSQIGDDMARVKAGMVLTLPEPPTQSTAAAPTR